MSNRHADQKLKTSQRMATKILASLNTKASTQLTVIATQSQAPTEETLLALNSDVSRVALKQSKLITLINTSKTRLSSP
jgi:hypothetical protein